MAEPATPLRSLILSAAWGGPDREASFVMRSLAGALSRHTNVDVATQGTLRDPSTLVPDGLFDVVRTAASGPIGAGAHNQWPDAGDALWSAFDVPAAVVVDAGDSDARRLVRSRFPDAALVTVATVDDDVGESPPDLVLELAWALSPPAPASAPVPGPDTDADADFAAHPPSSSTASRAVGLHVPINQLAAERRHYGLGFTGYVLVLSDRGGDPDPQDPTAAAAWLTSAFPALDVVVIEGGTATVWKARARRGAISVDTRADLWRLIAHASVTVDLAPGRLIARECVESLRFGVPIMTPSPSTGSELATIGGATFTDPAGLLGALESMADPAAARRAGSSGQVAAEQWHGDPVRCVEMLGEALASVVPRR